MVWVCVCVLCVGAIACLHLNSTLFHERFLTGDVGHEIADLVGRNLHNRERHTNQILTLEAVFTTPRTKTTPPIRVKCCEKGQVSVRGVWCIFLYLKSRGRGPTSAVHAMNSGLSDLARHQQSIIHVLLPLGSLGRFSHRLTGGGGLFTAPNYQ